ncbi:MAG: NUDIX domain-containing protein [Flavobacteriaceae bacterium]|nr:NUDIX domain-containing protein [Flavobacteriaceae bacterium]
MYKVFINDRPIILTNQVINDDKHEMFLMDEVNLDYLIERVNKGTLHKAYILAKDAQKPIKKLKKKIKTVVAAGGFVKNDKGDILFIHRNGRWDLPKGKREIYETTEAAAIREVTEETGVNKLEIVKFLGKTYHVFKRNGSYRLKITHWYEMKTTFKGKPRPEPEEGIDEVVWIHPDKVEAVLENCYANIRELFDRVIHANKTNV